MHINIEYKAQTYWKIPFLKRRLPPFCDQRTFPASASRDRLIFLPKIQELKLKICIKYKSIIENTRVLIDMLNVTKVQHID